MTFEQFVMALLTMVMCFSIGYDLCKLKYRKLLREKDELIEAHKTFAMRWTRKTKHRKNCFAPVTASSIRRKRLSAITETAKWS